MVMSCVRHMLVICMCLLSLVCDVRMYHLLFLVHVSISIGSWLFVHAGFTPAVVQYLRRKSTHPHVPLTLSMVNTALYTYLVDVVDEQNKALLLAILDGEHGPMWTRAY